MEPYICCIDIEGVQTTLEIDTGSASPLISLQTWQQFPTSTHSKLTKHNLPKLRTYSGEYIQPVGRASLNVRLKDKYHELSVLIVPGHGPNLLGRDWLTQLQLDWPAIADLNSVQMPKGFPLEFDALFTDELGTLKGVKATLTVDPDAPPHFCKARPVPYSVREKVERELEHLQTEGVLKPVTITEWASPIVPVLKSNGEIRLCGDYKVTVNKAVKTEKYPIPNVEDLYTRLAGATYYTKIDLSHAYQQSQLAEEAQKYTTINTTKGLFVYTRLCYGISSAPAIFQRIIDHTSATKCRRTQELFGPLELLSPLSGQRKHYPWSTTRTPSARQTLVLGDSAGESIQALKRATSVIKSARILPTRT